MLWIHDMQYGHRTLLCLSSEAGQASHAQAAMLCVVCNSIRLNMFMSWGATGTQQTRKISAVNSENA